MDNQQLIALRRDLHAHPELGFEEQRTAAIVADFLRQLDIEVHCGVGKTGVVGVLRRGTSPRTVGLRADMDALPMDDAGPQAWHSRHPGRCHACGHDGHTAILLGAAAQLARSTTFDGSVVFIFQPAEEGLAGAQAMIDDGLFSRFPCDAVYALHNWPELPLGTAQTLPGPIMAAADRFDIIVKGGGGHAAQPHLTPDTLLATSELVVQLNTIVARAVDPCEPALLTVTRVQGGFSHNMIPASASITGTVRTFNPQVQDIIEQRLHAMAQYVTAAHHLTAEVSYQRYYPATVNAPQQAEIALRAAHNAGLAASLAVKPALTSEDFAFMLQARPGAYLWLGSADSRPLHHSAYDFNDDVIPYGIRWFCEVVRETLPMKI
ncbi:M20 aminoacylase family protein [Serratia sp. AKBS12]|uniref:M20 aminoacylase family protein n=1 Tax=Serratia sp. AKBS12 TaxID=2974597 RepID=UPI0021660BB9|nr:M20 aminoacylase family protein [Serratia sp. AKBS12]MCS3408728.1 M20 family metallopeptidase [Serratia sp. AKBS12]HEI8865066.1 amidohydrolase [Serratia odorifera]